MRGASVLVGLIGLFLFARNAARSETPPRLEFEVASIRPFTRAPNGRALPSRTIGGPGTPDPNRILFTNLSLQMPGFVWATPVTSVMGFPTRLETSSGIPAAG
jgi:hypothetical protein